MGGNGARSATNATNALAAQAAQAIGATQSQVLLSARNLVQQGGAPNLAAAIQAIQASIPQPNPVKSRMLLWATMSQADENRIRSAMGQTGNEAGSTNVLPRDKTYAGTSKSFNVNMYLNSDGKEFVFPVKDENGKFLSSWHMHGLVEDNPTNPSMGVKQIIRGVDKGMRPLPENVNTLRCESSVQTLASLGIDKSMADLSKMSDAELRRTFLNRTRATKSYLSTTTNETGNQNIGFQKRDVIIEYSIMKGTHAIMTNNHAEREMLIGRGYDQKVTGARWERVTVAGKTSKKLVLNVRIVPGARSEWKDI